MDYNIIGKLITEYWRLLRAYERVVTALPPDNKLSSVSRNAERQLTAILAEANITIMNYEGQPYSPNLAVTLINSDEFEDGEYLRISQMIEPTLLQESKVLKVGKAIVEHVAKGD